jgi:predicted MFS family arabinose efflux permease
VSDHGTLAQRRWLVLASAMVSFFAVGMTFFAVPPLIATLRGSFGLSNLAIGALMGAIAVPAIVLSIPFGIAVDRWSGRRSGLAGLGLMLAGAVAFAVAPTYEVLIAGRVVFGVGALIINLLLARLLSAAFAGRELALAMALFTGVYPVSMIVLFSLHAWLEATLGWRGEMGVLAGLVVVAIPLHALAVPRTARGEAPSAPGALAAPPAPLVALGAAWMLYFVAFAAVPTFAPEWAGGGSRGLLVTSIITWVALAATPIVGGLIDRTGRAERWCVAATVLLAATLAGMSAGILSPVAAMFAMGIVAGSLPPAVYSLPGKLVAAERVGFAFGFITALSNLGTVIGPALAGAVRDATPQWSTVWGTLAVMALAAVAATALVRPHR